MEQHLDVLGQLAELRKWHEENCDNGGLESNNSSIALNSAEQARIYKLLGLSPSFICEIETSQTNSSSSNTNRLSVQGFNNSIKDDGNGTPSSEDPVKRMQINNDLSLGDSTESTGKEIVRRPFLKRGEGLTNRFKVDPDRYKLHNLPKYKFANHRKQRKSIESKEAANLKAKKGMALKILKNHTFLIFLGLFRYIAATFSGDCQELPEWFQEKLPESGGGRLPRAFSRYSRSDEGIGCH